MVLILLTHSLSLFYERVKISDDFLIHVNLRVILIEDYLLDYNVGLTRGGGVVAGTNALIPLISGN